MSGQSGRIRPRFPFVWQSRLPRSKSWCNRALILRSWSGEKDRPTLKIMDGGRELRLEELGDDVAKLEKALRLPPGETADLGASGTGFRFFLARRSRDAGVHVLRGSPRLLARPHEDLVQALTQLGVRIEVDGDAWRISSNGWKEPQGGWLTVSAATSSQFASALLLSAIDLPFEFRLRLTGEVVSAGYLSLSLQILRQSGIEVLTPTANEYVIPARQKLKVAELKAEPDLSTAATLAAMGLADPDSRVRFELDDEASARESLQPDREFWVLAHSLREPLRRGQKKLRAINGNLRGCPDLFPVLSALGALAEGTSTFQGAEHLRAKESDRVSGMVELLRGLKLDVVEFPDGLAVTGLGSWAKAKAHFAQLPTLRFDPRDDHRLAFAAGVLSLAGAKIELTDRRVVNKSFPNFWKTIEGGAPRYCVAGHRGVGKSTAMKRWQRWLGEVSVGIRAVDLDQEIESRCGRTVAQIFKESGEAEFRRLERQTFVALASERVEVPLIVFLGGGFDVTDVDDSWERVWLRRVTDQSDRLFVDDRPPLGEGDERVLWRQRRDEREARFAGWAEHIVELQEGAEQNEDLAERAAVLDLFNIASFPEIGGIYTLMRASCQTSVHKALRRGACLELRDDLLGRFESSEFHRLVNALPPGSRVLFSRRLASSPSVVSMPQRFVHADYDWPLEQVDEFSIVAPFLASQVGSRLVLSDHSSLSTEQIDARVRRALESWSGDPSRVWIKWAVPTRSFQELRERDQWRRSSPQRIFLPMSDDGRWKWYRLQVVPGEFQFWREGGGSAKDQPTSGEFLARRELAAEFFAAVVGSPVAHSRTPLAHREFFANMSWPVYAIQIEREEWAEAWGLLRDLGLRAAAVTSPLKEVVATHVGAGETAVNSVVWNRLGEFSAATSTDAAWSSILSTEAWSQLRPAVLWGGSGMISATRQMFPGVVCYSASLASPREGESSPPPKLLIWGAGSQELVNWPWGAHRPEVILDLSYQENSEARRVAKSFRARYISGLQLFDHQARAQREFFKRVLSPNF